MSVDDRERCTAYPLGGIAVYCVAAPSGLAVWLAAGGEVHYQGKNSNIPAVAGRSWSEGTARTLWNAIRCDSSWHGIRCTDLEGSGQSFTLGDYELIVDAPTGQRTYR